MLKELMQPKFKGNTLTIDISDFGYENYFVECSYHFDKKEGKYLLSMWLNYKDIEDRMRLSSKKVDTQYISGSRETIIENICRVVHQAATVADEDGVRYFDRFVKRYEYELACFERGNELFEIERLNISNTNNESDIISSLIKLLLDEHIKNSLFKPELCSLINKYDTLFAESEMNKKCV